MSHRSHEYICSHLGDEYDRYLGAIVPPIFQNTLFTKKTIDHGYTYTRESNPTIEIAEKKIAALEGGEAARCFSSGMAAISSAVMHWLSKDDHVICVKSVYPRARELLEAYLRKFGIEVTYVAGTRIDEFEQAIRPNTKLIYLESPSSLIFALQDLSAIAGLAQAYGIATVIDNTWATPLYQNPLKFGIDMVIHSTTKYIGGHSDILGGAIVSRESVLEESAFRERSLYGAVMDPHQAWLLIRSMRTLPVRMKQHQESAMLMARYLESHPAVSCVFYPGLESHPQYELGRRQMSGYSGVMAFTLNRSAERIEEAFRNLKLFESGPSWGGFESLLGHIRVDGQLATYLDIPPDTSLIRISVGLERIDSLIDDLDQNLSQFIQKKRSEKPCTK